MKTGLIMREIMEKKEDDAVEDEGDISCKDMQE
jgi:hypothetical protein